MITIFRLSIALVLLITSCSCNFLFEGIAGKGPVKTLKISALDDFDAIEASRGLEVILEKSNTNDVMIEANENLLEIIDVYVSNNTLVITSKKNIFSADAKKVYVKFDGIQRIEATSGSKVTNTAIIQERNMAITSSSGASVKLQISSDNLSCDASSGAGVVLSGYANHLEANSSSGSNINTEEVDAAHIRANASSGSNITVHSKKSFRGDASSGSSIRYSGNPEDVSESDSSGGSIRKI